MQLRPFASSHLHSVCVLAAFELAALRLLDYRSTVDKHNRMEIPLPDEKLTSIYRILHVACGWVE